MRVVNLTIPLYPHMPVGNVWAWDTPFRTTEIAAYEGPGARLFHISMHNEAGTRLMWGAVHHPEYPTLEGLDLAQFVGRPAVVVDVPKGPRGEIIAEDIEQTLARDRDVREGDAVILRTGWGEGQRWKEIGDDYAIQTPHFANDGAEAMVAAMKAKKTDLMLTDCAYIGNCGQHYMAREWAALPPWLRQPWPSDAAKAYLRNYNIEKHRADWGSSVILTDYLFTVAALCNLGALPKRCRLTILPMIIEKASGAPCTVVAEVE